MKKTFSTLVINLLFGIGLLLLSPASIAQDDTTKSTNKQWEIDHAKMLEYIEKNELEASYTQSGIYYVIEEAGEGGRPDYHSHVTAHYKGTLLNGDTFDSTEERGPGTFYLNGGVIQGWTEGIPLVEKGGKIKLIIPSYLAYGANSRGDKIPANSILVFDIELLDFKRQWDIDHASMLKYIEENDLDASYTQSGIYYIIEEMGEGEHPQANSTVKINYKGTLLDGSTFWDTHDNDKSPEEYTLNRVIQGWAEGVPLVKKGGKIKLIIPSIWAYGLRGWTNSDNKQVIPPHTSLVFDVELLDFK